MPFAFAGLNNRLRQFIATGESVEWIVSELVKKPLDDELRLELINLERRNDEVIAFKRLHRQLLDALDDGDFIEFVKQNQTDSVSFIADFRMAIDDYYNACVNTHYSAKFEASSEKLNWLKEWVWSSLKVIEASKTNAAKRISELEKINAAYELANSLLGTIRHMAHSKNEQLSSTVVIAGDHDPETERQLFESGLEEIRSRRNEVAEALQNGIETLGNLQGQARTRFIELMPRIQIAYPELGDFAIEGLTGGRCAWPALQDLSGSMQRWARKYQHVWSDPAPIKLDLEQSNHCEQIQAACPWSSEIDKALRHVDGGRKVQRSGREKGG